MILVQYELELTALIPEGWTVDAAWFGGPDVVGQWQVLLMQQDLTYLVTETDQYKRAHEVFRSDNKDAATEHFLLAVRRVLMDAQGVSYPDGEPLVG